MQFSMILNYETSHWIVRSFRYYHINFIPKVENTFILSLAHSTNRDNLKLKIGRSLMFLDVVHVTSAHVFQFFAQISEAKIKTSQNNTENKGTILVIQIDWFPKYWWIFWASYKCSVIFCTTFTMKSRVVLTKVIAFHSKRSPSFTKINRNLITAVL